MTLPRADDKPISYPFESACKKGCKYSCSNKLIFIFSSDQAHQLYKYAKEHNLLNVLFQQYKLIRKCDSLQDVSNLNIVCPFLNHETTNGTPPNNPDYLACAIHDTLDDGTPPRRIKPDACVVWNSPYINYCKDAAKFPEHIAVHNNSLLPTEFDIVKDIRAAVLNLPDNTRLTYGKFITDRRIELSNRHKK